MSKQVFTKCGVYSAGYNLTGYTNSVEVSMARDAVEVTAFGDTTRNYIPGLKANTISATAQFEAQLVDAVANASLGASGEDVVMTAPNPTAGQRAYILSALLTQYTPGAAVGDVLEANFSWGTRDDLVAGYLQNTPTTALTASGNGAAVQLGALSATQELWAAVTTLGVPSGTSPTLDVIVQSDDNGSMTSATTRGTFTQIVGARTHEIIRVSGAVADDYWRLSWTAGGTTPSFPVALAFGIVNTTI